MRKYIGYIAILISAFGFITSCNGVDDAITEPIIEGEAMTVPLSLYIESDNSLKSVNDPETITEITQVIKNLWIIQYNGTSDDSEILGEATYIEDFKTWYQQTPENRNVSLVATNKPCTIYFIANTFEDVGEFPVHKRTTIGDLKNRRRSTVNQESILSPESVIDDGGNQSIIYHPIFNGSITLDKLDNSVTLLSGTLKRNVAKASITINLTDNAINNDHLSIKSVQIQSVPSISYYVTQDVSAPFPLSSAFSKVSYPEISWPEGNNLSFTTYLPVNMRGVSSVSEESDKNAQAPDGSTYLLVSATYKEKGGENEPEYPITYSFYLGENMINDYNLVANKFYNYTFTINSKGDADSDSRIDDWGLVDFAELDKNGQYKYELSNCYILNPLITGNHMRNFRIPIARTKEFWGDGQTNNYGDKEGYSYRSLRGNAPWRCFILASDFEITDDNFQIVKGSGNSNTDTYFEVKVAPNTTGNVIIAVGPASDNTYSISWSWHLWITDYNPSIALEWGDGNDNTFLYPAQKGNMHRYKGDWWTNNKDAYIMDRNLGAFSAETYPTDNRGLLYYQYGRKDPFFQPSIYRKYPVDEKIASIHSYEVVKGFVATSKLEPTVENSIIYPLTFLYGTPPNTSIFVWNYDNIFNPVTTNKSIVWGDPLTATGKAKVGEKSIFDPCPPGFRVPKYNVWSDFRNHTNSKPTTNAFAKNNMDMSTAVYTRGFKAYNTIKGLQYWPYIEGEDVIPDNPVYIPAAGILYHNTGTINSHGNGSTECWAFLWSESNYDVGSARNLMSQPDTFDNSDYTHRSRGIPVRCITDWTK